MSKVQLSATIVKGLIGRELTAEETKTLDWLNGWEAETVGRVLALMNEAHTFGISQGKAYERMKSGLAGSKDRHDPT